MRSPAPAPWQLPGSDCGLPARPSPALPLTLTSAAQRLPQHLSSAQVAPAPAAPQRQVGEAVTLASFHRDAGILRLLEDAPHVAGPGRPRPPPQSLLQTRPEGASGSRGPRLGFRVPPGRPPGAAPLVRPGCRGEGRGGAAARGASGGRRRLGAAQALQITRRFRVQEQPVGSLPDGRGRHGHAGREQRSQRSRGSRVSPERRAAAHERAFKGTAACRAGRGGAEAGRPARGRKAPRELPIRQAAGSRGERGFRGVCGKQTRRLGQLKRSCCRDRQPSALPPSLSHNFHH